LSDGKCQLKFDGVWIWVKSHWRIFNHFLLLVFSSVTLPLSIICENVFSTLLSGKCVGFYEYLKFQYCDFKAIESLFLQNKTNSKFSKKTFVRSIRNKISAKNQPKFSQQIHKKIKTIRFTLLSIQQQERLNTSKVWTKTFPMSNTFPSKSSFYVCSLCIHKKNLFKQKTIKYSNLLFGTSEKKNFVQNKFDVGELLVDYVSGLSIFFTPPLNQLQILKIGNP
jgi:hypothetical protein